MEGQSKSIELLQFLDNFFQSFTMRIHRLAARVFCQLEGGGNPVTVFSKLDGGDLSESSRESLAKSCEWESVMIGGDKSDDDSSSSISHRMFFYLPTGEEVSFCAHAALGGIFHLATQQLEKRLSFSVPAQKSTYQGILHEESIVSLDMEAPFEENKVELPSLLHRLLRECHGVKAGSLMKRVALGGVPYPSFCNSSIARPKTLVCLNSVDSVNQIIPPPLNNDNYRISCDALGSTGLYLYAPREIEGEFECRQFPRASGYVEDPATGIAAGALAISLYERGSGLKSYKFFQGTAMGKPSLILVENVRKVSNDGSSYAFRLMGRVEVDSSDEIEL